MKTQTKQETAKNQRGNKMQKEFKLVYDVSIYDDGTLDACVNVFNNYTQRSTVLRYSPEYRESFDSDADFLESAFDDYAEQLAEMLLYSTDF